MIKAIIFDLDNCLSAANEPGDELFAPAFAAIRTANHDRLSESELQAAFADCWRHPLDHVAAIHGFSQEMLDAGWQVFATTSVACKMLGYPDLPVLADLPVSRHLVTSGFRKLQESKIDALGIRHWFASVFVDAIDEDNRIGKAGRFQRILTEFHLAATEVFVVGDNPDSEIAAGNRLGIETIQILRPGVTPSSAANRQIHGLSELLPWI